MTAVEEQRGKPGSGEAIEGDRRAHGGWELSRGAEKTRVLWSFITGKILFLYLRFRERRFVRATRPLAEHLEVDIFPQLRQEGIGWMTFELESEAGRDFLTGSSGRREYTFPGTTPLATVLRRRGVRRLRLDTRLEFGQIVQALLLLLYAAPSLEARNRGTAESAGWSRQAIAAGMLDGPGLHRFCSLLRFDPAEGLFEVEYTYCELFFSRAVREYIHLRSRYSDHRALFAAGPVVGVLVAALLVVPVVLFPIYFEAGLVLWAIVTILLAVGAGAVTYGLGAIQYDREHREALVREYASRLNALARFPESNPNPIVKLDRRGEIVYLNPAARAFLEELGIDEADAHRILPPDSPAAIQKCLKEGCRGESEVNVRGRVVRYVFSPFTDEESVIFSGDDITRLRETERELQRVNRELRDLVEMKDEFLRIASHDLKNPLTSVLGTVGLVRDLVPPGTTMPEKLHSTVSRSFARAKEMQQIVEDFLDFQAFEDGEIRLELQAVNLNELAKEVTGRNADDAKGKNISFVVETAERLPDVQADPARISQVIQNLVGNAVKFSSEGCKVIVSTHSADGSVSLEVRDCGPGLTPEDLEKVFGKYSRLSNKPTGDEKSSGLGLYICRLLVEAHGGEIGVRNNPDRGATFWFRIPAAEKNDEA